VGSTGRLRMGFSRILDLLASGKQGSSVALGGGRIFFG
jgi:hypothetical protein